MKSQEKINFNTFWQNFMFIDEPNSESDQTTFFIYQQKVTYIPKHLVICRNLDIRNADINNIVGEKN